MPLQSNVPAQQGDQVQIRGDILAITDKSPGVYDVSVAHPLQTAPLNAADERDGASGTKRRQQPQKEPLSPRGRGTHAQGLCVGNQAMVGLTVML